MLCLEKSNVRNVTEVRILQLFVQVWKLFVLCHILSYKFYYKCTRELVSLTWKVLYIVILSVTVNLRRTRKRAWVGTNREFIRGGGSCVHKYEQTSHHVCTVVAVSGAAGTDQRYRGFRIFKEGALDGRVINSLQVIKRGWILIRVDVA